MHNRLISSLFLILFLSSLGSACSQCVVLKEQANYVVWTTRIDVTLYKVENRSSDTIYLWIDTLSHDTSEFNNLLNYMGHPPCECRRGWMIYDQVLLHDGLVVNCNFMKKLLPGDVFRIDCTRDVGLMEGDIHYVDIEKLSKAASVPANDRYLYESDFILLTKDFIEKK